MFGRQMENKENENCVKRETESWKTENPKNRKSKLVHRANSWVKRTSKMKKKIKNKERYKRHPLCGLLRFFLLLLLLPVFIVVIQKILKKYAINSKYLVYSYLE